MPTLKARESRHLEGHMFIPKYGEPTHAGATRRIRNDTLY